MIANASDPHSHTEVLLPCFRGRQEAAAYNEQCLPAYRNNPLIEALPNILTNQQAAKLLRRGEPYQPELRRAADEIRLQQIMNSVRFFEPMQIHLNVEQRFSCLIRMGYVGRNPLSHSFWQTLKAQVGQIHDHPAEPQQTSAWPFSTPLGFSMVGISGIGKTLTVENVLSLYPQVIFHSRYQGQPFSHIQIVWLKLDCPFDGSTRALCLNFFAAIDNLIKTNYYGEFTRRGQAHTDEMLPHMARVAGIHSIGVLVMDEIQNLSLLRAGGWSKMLNFNVQLINTIGMPVVQIGTPKALPVLQGEFRQARRGSGQGDLLWDRMAPDAVWRYFVEALWTYQYVRRECPLTDALCDTLYDECQGITDFAVKLYFLAQMRAIRAHTECVTPETIRSVAEDDLRLAQPVLTALRTGQYEKLVTLHVDDLFPVDWQREVQHVLQGVGRAGLTPMAHAPQSKHRPGANCSGQSKPSVTRSRQKADKMSRQQSIMAGGLLQSVVQGRPRKLSAYDALCADGFARPAHEWFGASTAA